MIEGITVLNQTTQWTCGVETIFIGIFFLVFGLALGAIAIWARGDEGEKFFAGMLAIILIFSGICITSIYIGRASYQVYQVTINDSANIKLGEMKDFLDKYEIVKQEGKIYIIKDKVK